MGYVWEAEVTDVYGQVIQRIKDLYAATPRQWLGKPLLHDAIEATVDPSGKVNVADESPDSVAGQFYDYMPGHSFKVQYLIDQLDLRYSLPLHTNERVLPSSILVVAARQQQQHLSTLY